MSEFFLLLFKERLSFSRLFLAQQSARRKLTCVMSIPRAASATMTCFFETECFFISKKRKKTRK